MARLRFNPVRGPLRVPEITVYFWLIKGLSTAMGESTSDYLVHAMAPVAAVAIGLVAFIAALGLQFRQQRYRAWTYWLAVVMVGVFGTMAADVLHVGFSVPYAATSILYGAVLAVVFVAWWRSQHTLSIHSIDSSTREAFYWAAVVATFALGTAAGDLTALALNLGFWPSVLIFAAIISVPAIGGLRLGWNPILSFWLAYIVTRPLGASFADGFSKPTNGGLNLGDPLVSLIAFVIFVGLVGYAQITKCDVQDHREAVHAPMPRWAVEPAE
jgi:uncharacterized membrane-anchored protein